MAVVTTDKSKTSGEPLVTHGHFLCNLHKTGGTDDE